MSSISIRAAFIKAEIEYGFFEPEFTTIATQSALLVTDRHVAGGHVGGAAPLTLHSRIAN